MLDLTHKLWVAYIQDVLKLNDKTNTSSLQYQADRKEQEPGDPPSLVLGSLSGNAPVALSKADMTGASIRGAYQRKPDI